MKHLAAVVLLCALSLAAVAGALVAPASEADASAAEYVYLHQTRNKTGAFQDISDRSNFQCAAY